MEVLILLILAAGLFLAAKVAKLGKEHIQTDEVIKNENIPADEWETMSGYTNIALFGVDSRSGQLESGTNSDTIMICSINDITKEVKLVSIYRDTYLDDGTGS